MTIYTNNNAIYILVKGKRCEGSECLGKWKGARYNGGANIDK